MTIDLPGTPSTVSIVVSRELAEYLEAVAPRSATREHPFPVRFERIEAQTRGLSRAEHPIRRQQAVELEAALRKAIGS